jgi:hypothetical protein
MGRPGIGPGPRHAHAMAYDSARRSIVLFGGLPTAAIANPLGDTWEHIETDVNEAAPPPPIPGQTAEVQVISLALEPPSALSGSQVLATITLDAPAPAGGTQVELGWVQQGQGVVTLLNTVNVNEGASSVVIPFTAPQAPSGAVLQIVAATPNNIGVSADLQVN